MKAMILKETSLAEKEPLEMIDLPIPEPKPKEILLRVLTCGVCHTELDEIEGRLQSKLPVIPGHEIVGRVVVNAIRKEEIDKDCLLRLDYGKHLWQEKELKSVANITRKDAQDFLPLAAKIPILPKTQEFRLEEANQVLASLKQGIVQGAAVLRISN